MKTTTVLVVDDEPLARKRLTRLLDDRPDVTVIGEASDGKEAVAAVRELRPDLLFLDVQMPDGSGIQVLEDVGLEAIGAVVFVTAYDRFALQAFDLHAVDYLLKPFTDERFEQALERALGRLRRSAAETVTDHLVATLKEFDGVRPGQAKDLADESSSLGRRTLSVKLGGRVRILRTDEIDWLEASGSYVRLHLRKGNCLVRETLTALVGRLPQTDFLRIHRSTAVNLNRVVELLPFSHRELVVVLADGTRLKLSRTYRDAIEKRLGL